MTLVKKYIGTKMYSKLYVKLHRENNLCKIAENIVQLPMEIPIWTIQQQVRNDTSK